MANTIRGLLPDGTLPAPAEQQVRELIDGLDPLPAGGNAGQALVRTAAGDTAWATVGNLTWTQEAQARAQGFWIVVSPTEPAEHVYELSDGTTVPIIWQKPVTMLVPVVPSEPIWDIFNGTVMVPDLAGVEYRTAAGTLIPPGEAVDVTPTVPTTVTIHAHAKPGYRLPFAMSWTHDFPDPSARTLVASSAFTADQPNVPIVWDNALGGTAAVEFGSADTIPGYRALGGVLTPNGTGTDNAYVQAFYPSGNILLEFEVVATGTTTSSLVNAVLSEVSIRTSSKFTGGVRLRFLKSGYGPTMAGTDLALPTTSASEYLGVWRMGVFGETVSVTTPKGETYTGTTTSNLDTQTDGSRHLHVRHFADASGFAYDNFKLYELGA